MQCALCTPSSIHQVNSQDRVYLGSLWSGSSGTRYLGNSEYIRGYPQPFCPREICQETSQSGQCVFAAVWSAQDKTGLVSPELYLAFLLFVYLLGRHRIPVCI